PLDSLLWKLLSCVILVASLPLIWYLKFLSFGKTHPIFGITLVAAWWIALAQAVGLKVLTRRSLGLCIVLMLLLDGLVFQTYVIFQGVTDYPFSLGWSEASRYYYGSLPFSESLYGMQLPLSIWHGTRYFLLAIPFLIKGLPLWADRLWQSLLWFGLTAATTWILVKRLKPRDISVKLIIGGWFFLFLFQGAVYYHLQICVILILLGVSPSRPWRSLMAVIAASFWAGMSRINWYPVPAMLAISLYMLEVPYRPTNHFWKYIAAPALWMAVGLLVALGGQAFYIWISGNTDLSAFNSSLHSPLLWYRWFPNDTNPLGIVPGILLVSLPIFALLFQSLRGHLSYLHLLRWLGLLAIVVVLFLGGLVVSSKIGGGGDLHNMDAYMVTLGLLAAYFLTQRVQPETDSSPRLEAATWPILVALLVVPTAFSLSRLSQPIQYDRAQASRDLSSLRTIVQAYSKSGEVLFMYERHLLTFGTISDIPLVQDYEVLPLMEMAISDNQPYLAKFNQDILNHRFAAIVARKPNLRSSGGDFAEESNVWNHLVAYPLLCEYQPVLTLQSSNIQVFVPRATRDCPSSRYFPDQP
ncbi:MAG TPA: hypothetical protein VHM28_11940, partial [Anaerolineales bacterium]|nr:hypothetical protein [Anaerolineales bacterium]